MFWFHCFSQKTIVKIVNNVVTLRKVSDLEAGEFVLAAVSQGMNGRYSNGR